MKTRLLAFLLCFVLVLSACLMTACGGSKNDKVVEVTEDEARETALASFFQGIDALRHGGIVITGSVKGSATETDDAGEKKTYPIDLNLTLNYNDEKFDAVAEGTSNGEDGRFEIYFDGTLVGLIGRGGEEEPDGEVHFLDEEVAKLPIPGLTPDEEGAYTAILDQIAGLIDFEKVAANVSNATKGVIVVSTKGKNYVITASSDGLFDVALNTLNILKNSGDKTVAELLDALCGEGASEKLLAELGEIQGTDKLVDLLPKVEGVLSDLGLKVDALYDLLAKTFMGDEATGEQLKAFIVTALGEMTVDEGIEYLFNMISEMLGSIIGSIFDSMFDNGAENEEIGEGEVEPMNSADPAAAGAVDGETDGETDEESGAPTWAMICGMIQGFLAGNVNDSFGTFFGTDKDETTGEPIPFDIATEVEPAIAAVTALKDAIKFNVTVTCDGKLNPTAVDLTLSVDTEKFPEDMGADPANVTLTLSAKIKDNVTVTPSEAMAAQIADAKAKREPAPAGE